MGFIITSLAVMTFVFVFLFKKISKEKYRIVETVTVPNDGFEEVKHLDDSEKEEFILKKSENDIKQYIINNENISDTNVNVLASVIVEVKDDMNSNTYIVNTIVYIEYVNEQRRQYTKYGVKYIEDKNDSNTETSKRCRGCGSEMQGNKCKYCGLTATENEVELTTVEIYKIK